jgi:anti-anti-sigma factor
MELLHTVKGPDRSGVVWVSGEIDMSSIADLTERLGCVPDPLLLDLSHVEFLAASGCGVLVAERRRREATWGWLRIMATSRPWTASSTSPG